MITKDERKVIVQDTENHLKNSNNTVIILNYYGINADELYELRTALSALSSTSKVIRNTLFHIAAKNSNLDLENMEGQLLYVFVEAQNLLSVITLLKKYIDEFKIVKLACLIDSGSRCESGFKYISKYPSVDFLHYKYYVNMKMYLMMKARSLQVYFNKAHLAFEAYKGSKL